MHWPPSHSTPKPHLLWSNFLNFQILLQISRKWQKVLKCWVRSQYKLKKKYPIYLTGIFFILVANLKWYFMEIHWRKTMLALLNLKLTSILLFFLQLKKLYFENHWKGPFIPLANLAPNFTEIYQQLHLPCSSQDRNDRTKLLSLDMLYCIQHTEIVQLLVSPTDWTQLIIAVLKNFKAFNEYSILL